MFLSTTIYFIIPLVLRVAHSTLLFMAPVLQLLKVISLLLRILTKIFALKEILFGMDQAIIHLELKKLTRDVNHRIRPVLNLS